jgi:hypothetical protein
MTDYSDRHYSQTDRHLLIIVDVLGERHCPLAKFFFPRQVHSHNIPPPFLPQSTTFHSESDVDRQISKAFNGRTWPIWSSSMSTIHRLTLTSTLCNYFFFYEINSLHYISQQIMSSSHHWIFGFPFFGDYLSNNRQGFFKTVLLKYSLFLLIFIFLASV